MNKKSLLYSGVLLFALLLAALLLQQGVIQSAAENPTVSLSLDDNEYLLGQPIEFTSRVNIFDENPTTVQLVVSGPEPFTCNLPTAAGSYVLTANECSTFPGGVLDLVVQLVLTSLPGGTLPGGGTLPKGVSLATTRTFILTWFPPINLTAPPSFALLTNGLTENKFPIPQLQAATGPGGIVLPNTEPVFTIPTIGAPAGTVLPGADFAFNIPTLSATSNASSTVPDLPDTSGAPNFGFNIPDLVALGLVASAPTSTATFPDTSAAFNIPDLVALGLVASAPGGVPNLPSIANAFNVPGSAVPRGMAADGADFWIVVDDNPNDKILKVNSSGATTTAAIIGPGNNLEGVAFLNGFLWVVENQFRCFDLIDTARCDRQHRVFKVDPASPPSGGESAWASLTKINGPETFAQIADIAGEGSGASASLWLAKQDGGQFYNISQNGSVLSSPFLDRFVGGEDAIAFKDNSLFTAKGGTITQWTKDGKFINEFSTTASNIRGMAFSSGVLFLATGTGVVSKTFVPVNVTNDPRGIAFSPSTAAVGRAVWILVDAEPKDKLLKVNPDTGALISSFGTDGFVDGPSKDTEGVTFLSPNLWVVANENFVPKLFKVNASTGVVEQTFDLQSTAQIFGEVGGITDDATNLFVHEKNGNGVTVLSAVNATKTGLEQAFPCCPSNFGARSFSFNTSRKQFFAGKSAKVAAYNNSLAFVQDFDLTQTGGTISGIQGMTFDGDTLYIAHTGSGKVSKSFLATTVTTKPRGVAFSAATSGPGKALWILVDAEPFDKLLKVDPETGLLISTFGTSGFVDGPSKDTEGVTYLDTGAASTSFLWAIANESATRKLFKINATTGAVVSTFDLSSTANVFNDLGGIANDGINLVAYSKDSNQMFVIDTAGAKVEESFPCCTQSFTSFGAKSVAFHSGRKQFFAAKSQNLLTIDSTRTLITQERSLTLNGSTFPGSVEGMAFDGDVLYVGRTEAGAGKISIGALRKSVGNSPRGLALSPSGSILAGTPIGRALWVLVDGDPKDLVLKLDPDANGALITSFDAPSKQTDGITFLSNHLWIVAEEANDRKLFKVNPVTGATVSTFNLSGFPGGFVFETIGGITNDGTDLLLFTKDFHRLFKVDTSGGKVSDTSPCCPQTQGATGVAFRTANNQLLAANGSKIVQYVQEGNQFNSTDEFDLTATLSGIQGMTLDPVGAGADDDLLYIAHIQAGSGKISKTGVPSDTTNSPRGLAYDAGANELYILVDGKAKDRIVVVNPAPTGSPTVVRSFPAPSNNAESITFLNGSLFVGIHNQDTCCPPPPPEIVKLNPTTGAEVARLNVGQALFSSKATGLSNNGQFLIAVAEFGGEAVFIDPADGSQESRTFFFDPQNPQFFVDGLQGLAFQSSTEEFFPVKGTKVFRFASEGRKIEEFTVATQNVSQLRGATFVGNLLYLAEANGKTIQRAGIPVPQVTITTDPRAMATDGNALYVAVDASPTDKIMKLNKTTGALVAGFGAGGAADAPGNETEGLAFHKGFLYAVTNDVRTIEGPFGGFFQQTLPLIHKLATTTGAELSKNPILVQQFGPGPGPGGPPPGSFMDPIGALASDGQFLYAGVKGTQQVTGRWLKFDPDSPGTPAQPVDEFPGVLAFMPGFESFEITKGPQFPANRQLLASGNTGGGPNNVIARFDRVTGAMFDQFVLSGGPDVMGMAYIGITLFMADDTTNSIIGTQLPENTTEVSLIGSYNSQASVAAPSGSSQTGSVPFTIVKNPSVVVKLTNPPPDFVLTSVDTTIAGLINDPAAATVDVGIKLPFTAVVSDEVSASSGNLWSVNNQLGGAALWHVACGNASPGFPSIPRVSSSPCSWRYGIPGAPSFDTGAQTAGLLVLKAPVEVTQGMRLRFFTGYITEVVPEADRKLILVATVTTDLQGNDVVGPFNPFARIVGKGFGGAPPPPTALPGFRNIELEPLFITPNLVNVSLDLSQFAGSRIKVAFKFDSVNKFANQGEGWFLDGIGIEGASVKRVTVNATLLSSPQVVGGVEFHRSFSTPFTLAEGSIDLLRAEADQPYAPFLSGFDQISGFVDSQAPVLTLAGIPANTNQSAQTLLGTVQDITFDSLDVTQTTSLGSQVIFGLGSLPTDGAFSLPVSLVEGVNTFTAVARDKGNASSTKQLLAVLDTAAPAVRDDGTIFPVGAVSARPGDEVIFQVTADDGAGAVSGVSKVELVIGGQVQQQLLRASEIPAIVREQFGIKGQWVLFETVPTGLPPGEFEVRLRATDNAGNSLETPVTGEVTASLKSMNIFLFDGANLVGVNLQASPGPDFDILNVLAQALDTSELEPSFEEGVINSLGNTSSTASVLGKTTIPVLSTTGFQAGDRVMIGSGVEGSRLAANSFPNASSIKVVSTSGFMVGDTIAVTTEVAPFGLGFTRPVTTTVASIVDSQTLALGTPLAENHFVGERVSRSQGARVTAVDSSANTITIVGKVIVGPSSTSVGVMEEPKLGDVISAIFHFTGGLSVGLGSDQGVFQQFIPGVGGDLTALKQGRGYWFIAKPSAFARSAPLPGFRKGPIIPVRMQLDGVLFDAAGSPPSLPATVDLSKPGWHQVAVISEKDRVVERGARGLLFPIRKFTSLVEFQKFIGFNSSTGVVEVLGGVFNPLFAGDLATPGDLMKIARGFYLFLTVPGTHTP